MHLVPIFTLSMFVQHLERKAVEMTSVSSAPVIDVQHIDKFFHAPRRLRALNRVSCAVAPGEVVVVAPPARASRPSCAV